MSTPPPYEVAYAVTYSSASDSFVFTFSSYYPICSVPRVGFTCLQNQAIVNGVTFYSVIGPAGVITDGVTVRWDLCSAPSGSVSATALYTAILALYTGGGGGTVTSVTAGTGLTATGTANAPVLNITNVGTAGTTTLAKIVTNAQGQVTSATAGTAADINAALGYTAANVAAVVNTITAGTNITLGGTATNRVINATGAGVTSVIGGNRIAIGGSGANPVVNYDASPDCVIQSPNSATLTASFVPVPITILGGGWTQTTANSVTYNGPNAFFFCTVSARLQVTGLSAVAHVSLAINGLVEQSFEVSSTESQKVLTFSQLVLVPTGSTIQLQAKCDTASFCYLLDNNCLFTRMG